MQSFDQRARAQSELDRVFGGLYVLRSKDELDRSSFLEAARMAADIAREAGVAPDDVIGPARQVHPGGLSLCMTGTGMDGSYETPCHLVENLTGLLTLLNAMTDYVPVEADEVEHDTTTESKIRQLDKYMAEQLERTG